MSIPRLFSVPQLAKIWGGNLTTEQKVSQIRQEHGAPLCTREHLMNLDQPSDLLTKTLQRGFDDWPIGLARGVTMLGLDETQDADQVVLNAVIDLPQQFGLGRGILAGLFVQPGQLYLLEG